jgi:ubiquitin-activating enzyme E1
LDYIISASNLHAFNYGLRGETNPAAFHKIVDSIIVPEFTPKSGVKVQISDSEPVAQSLGSGKSLTSIIISLQFN